MTRTARSLGTAFVLLVGMAPSGHALGSFVIAKDPFAGITKGAGLDPAQISVAFDLWYDNGATVGSFVLPAGMHDGTSGWLTNRSSVAKFVNRAAPSGPTAAKSAVIKPGRLLKLVGKSLGDAPLDVPALLALHELRLQVDRSRYGRETRVPARCADRLSVTTARRWERSSIESARVRRAPPSLCARCGERAHRE